MGCAWILQQSRNAIAAGDRPGDALVDGHANILEPCFASRGEGVGGSVGGHCQDVGCGRGEVKGSPKLHEAKLEGFVCKEKEKVQEKVFSEGGK